MPSTPREGTEQSALAAECAQQELNFRWVQTMTARAAATSGGSSGAGGASAATVGAASSRQQQLQVAVLLLQRGRHQEALKALQPLLAEHAGSPQLQCLHGCCYAALSSRPQALAAFAAALAEDPACVPALVGCAAVYKESGLLGEALQALQRALQLLEPAVVPAAAAEVGGAAAQEAAAAAAAGDAEAAGAGAEAGAAPLAGGAQETTAAVRAAAGGPAAVRAAAGGAAAAGAAEPGQAAAARADGAGNGAVGADAALAALDAGMPTAAEGGSDCAKDSLSSSAAAGVLAGCIPCSLADVQQALAVVLTDLGTQSKLAGQEGWRRHYEHAIRVCPGYAPAHYNMGVAAAEAGNAAKAIGHYSKAVQLAPRYAEAWCNMGVMHKQQGRLEEAIAAYEQALAASPNLEVVQLNLAAALTQYGTVVKSAGRVTEGLAAYERALALAPRHAEALYNLGVAYTELGQIDKALFMYQTTLIVQPGCAEAHNNLGVLYRELGNMERAMQCYQAALNARPNFPQGLNNLAVVYTQQGRAQEALQLLHAAVMAAPSYAEAYNNLGVLQRDVGALHDAIASYQRCLELDPANRHAGQNLLLALNYVHHGESRLVSQAHAQWGRRFQELHPQLPPLTAADVDTTEGRPLVVGYVSPDLFTHSVSYFAEAPLAHHSPSAVRHIVYSCVSKPDSKTAKIKAEVLAAGGTWRDVARLPEADLADLIRSDRVDVLVELTGHTASNRLGAVARRPAPVQVTWIGYPNSTGLSSVDYRFTDAICDPKDTAQTFTEELIRLPGCFLCYTPAPDAPLVAPAPCAANGFVTFGSFNALAKQTPEVLLVWARILLAVPGSRLVLKNKPFACEVVRNQFWRVFEDAGVERSRVDLLPLAAANKDHMAQYAMMDISLDPWPYAGTTTTTESLFMGVPCLTLAGSCHAHNVGVSLLTAVGLQDEWVAHTVEEYVAKATALASQPERLAELRRGLRQRMMQSPLCDATAFVRQLEGVYRQLWQRWLTQQQQEEQQQQQQQPLQQPQQQLEPVPRE